MYCSAISRIVSASGPAKSMRSPRWPSTTQVTTEPRELVGVARTAICTFRGSRMLRRIAASSRQPLQQPVEGRRAGDRPRHAAASARTPPNGASRASTGAAPCARARRSRRARCGRPRPARRRAGARRCPGCRRPSASAPVAGLERPRRATGECVAAWTIVSTPPTASAIPSPVARSPSTQLTALSPAGCRAEHAYAVRRRARGAPPPSARDDPCLRLPESSFHPLPLCPLGMNRATYPGEGGETAAAEFRKLRELRDAPRSASSRRKGIPFQAWAERRNVGAHPRKSAGRRPKRRDDR